MTIPVTTQPSTPRARGIEHATESFLPLFLEIDPAARPRRTRAHAAERSTPGETSVLSTTAATIDGLVVALERRDPATGRHCRRVSALADALAAAGGLRGDDRRLVRLAGLAHDLGKHLVPEDLLRSGVRLEAASTDALRRHPALAEALLAFLPGISPVLPAIRAHHERWDGEGYPDGLAGRSIPIAARIVAVADAFDAMRMDRAYAAGLSESDARAEIERGAGTQFDPAVVRLLRRVDTRAHAVRLVADGVAATAPIARAA